MIMVWAVLLDSSLRQSACSIKLFSILLIQSKQQQLILVSFHIFVGLILRIYSRAYGLTNNNLLAGYKLMRKTKQVSGYKFRQPASKQQQQEPIPSLLKGQIGQLPRESQPGQLPHENQPGQLPHESRPHSGLPQLKGNQEEDPLNQSFNQEPNPPTFGGEFQGNKAISKLYPQNTQQSPIVQGQNEMFLKAKQLMLQIIDSINKEYGSSYKQGYAKRQRDRKLQLAQELKKMLRAGYVPLRLLHPNQDWYTYCCKVQQLALSQKIWQTYVFFHRKQFWRPFKIEQQKQCQFGLMQLILLHRLTDIFEQIKQFLLRGQRQRLKVHIFKMDWHLTRDQYYVDLLNLYQNEVRKFMYQNQITSLCIENVTGWGKHSVNYPKLSSTFQSWVAIQIQEKRVRQCISQNNNGSFILKYQGLPQVAPAI